MAPNIVFGFRYAVPKSPPPLKIPFSERREREFLYLPEVDSLIAATQKTLSNTRNGALAMLLFCQALQPIELCWLRWCDVNFTDALLLVVRNRSKSTCLHQQIVTNLQPLCSSEIDLLSQLKEERTTDWVFASERKQRLSERSLHHIIQQAGEIAIQNAAAAAIAEMPSPVHPYMLRKSGIYYRAALLLQGTGLSLRQCCLLRNWHATSVPISTQDEQEYYAITTAQENAFFKALEQIKTFSGICVYENVVDYLLGAFTLFPRIFENSLQLLARSPSVALANFAENI